jgi:KilA-N domain
MKNIKVKNIDISIISKDKNDYISLTDIIKAKDGDFFISDWLRNRNTIEFLGIWEQLNNPDFNYGEFTVIKSFAGLNNYKLSVKEWIQKTGGIALRASSGRYGGTFAHKDIAFEFATWISPEFKFCLIKEFQRLKDDESVNARLEWNVNRYLTKINYKIHTNSIKENIIVPNKISIKDSNVIYANEADILNMALFGITAKDWKINNKDLEGNMRDYADVTQLICLSNLEVLNSEFIKSGLGQQERLIRLNEIAISQMTLLVNNNTTIKKLV